MGTPPDALLRLIDHFDQNRKVFLSGECKRAQSLKAKTPHEAEALQRQIAATDEQIDQLAYELHGLTEEGISIVEGG